MLLSILKRVESALSGDSVARLDRSIKWLDIVGDHALRNASLPRTFCPLRINLLNLLHVLLRCLMIIIIWSVVLPIGLSSGLGACSMEASHHSLVHNEFGWGLNLGGWWAEVDTGQVAGGVQVPLLVSGDLLIDIVLARVSFELLHYQIVSTGNLVVLVVLDEGYCLLQLVLTKVVF